MFQPSNQPSVLDITIKAEESIFLENLKASYTSHTTIDAIDEGNILYKVPLKRTAVATLLDGATANCVDPLKAGASPREYFYDFTFMEQVTEQFINIDANATFTECLNTIYRYQSAAGLNFYGALLRSVDNPDIIINPYHVLTALSVMENDEYRDTLKFNILIYIYTDRDNIDHTYRTHYADPTLIENNLNALLQTYTSKLPTITEVQSITPRHQDDMHEFTAVVLYNETLSPEEDPRHTYHIVTQQVVTQGIIAPYYGTSIIEWKHYDDGTIENCQGTSVSPMRSANINRSDHYSPRKASHNVEMGSVCTGALSNHTYNGLRTLTHSNLSSAHNSSNLVDGFPAYVDAMIAKSTDLYLRAGILQPLVAPPKPSYRQRFSEEQIDATSLSEFLRATSSIDENKPTLATARNLYRELQELKAEEAAANPPVEEPSESTPVPEAPPITF